MPLETQGKATAAAASVIVDYQLHYVSVKLSVKSMESERATTPATRAVQAAVTATDYAAVDGALLLLLLVDALECPLGPSWPASAALVICCDCLRSA